MSDVDRSRGAALPFAPASERNKRPILDALSGRMPARGLLLEIGAGTGQHATFMAPRFPEIEWLATDRAESLDGLRRRVAAECASNLRAPRRLDVLADRWPSGPYAAAFSANTAHIMPWPAVEAMVAGLGRGLATGAPFFLYGPFSINGRHNSPGNAAFDRALRAEGGGQGLRDVADLESLAARHHLTLDERVDMPANNSLLVFRSRRDRENGR